MFDKGSVRFGIFGGELLNVIDVFWIVWNWFLCGFGYGELIKVIIGVFVEEDFVVFFFDDDVLRVVGARGVYDGG